LRRALSVQELDWGRLAAVQGAWAAAPAIRCAKLRPAKSVERRGWCLRSLVGRDGEKTQRFCGLQPCAMWRRHRPLSCRQRAEADDAVRKMGRTQLDRMLVGSRSRLHRCLSCRTRTVPIAAKPGWRIAMRGTRFAAMFHFSLRGHGCRLRATNPEAEMFDRARFAEDRRPFRAIENALYRDWFVLHRARRHVAQLRSAG